LDLRLPELEAFMAEDQAKLITGSTGDIHAHDVIGVDIDLLETDDDFLEAGLLVPQQVNIGVSNVKLVIPFNKEFSSLGFVLRHF
jgi:hypothetical protein